METSLSISSPNMYRQVRLPLLYHTLEHLDLIYFNTNIKKKKTNTISDEVIVFKRFFKIPSSLRGFHNLALFSIRVFLLILVNSSP